MSIKIRMLAFVPCLAGVLWLAAGQASAAIVLNENFDDDPVGGLADTPDYYLGSVAQYPPGPPKTTVQVAGPGGPYVDPFVGDATNHSLVLDNFGGGAVAPVRFPVVAWKNEFDGPLIRNATIDFDLIMKRERVNPPAFDDFWSYFEVRMGFTHPTIGTVVLPPQTLGDIIVWNSWRIQGGSPLIYNNAQNQVPNISPITPDVSMHVQYKINPDETWELTVNGTPILYAGNAKVPWAFGGPQAGLQSLSFMTAFGLKSTDVYVDNLVVNAVPEPASVALLATGGLLGLAMMLRRRRKAA